MPAETPKPCPKCKRQVTLLQTGHADWSVACDTSWCVPTDIIATTRLEAIRRWNTRAGSTR